MASPVASFLNLFLEGLIFVAAPPLRRRFPHGIVLVLHEEAADETEEVELMEL